MLAAVDSACLGNMKQYGSRTICLRSLHTRNIKHLVNITRIYCPADTYRIVAQLFTYCLLKMLISQLQR